MEAKPEPRPPIERDPKDPKKGDTKHNWNHPEYMEALKAHKESLVKKEEPKKK